FSLGLAMHEVLTGKVPFEGPKLELALRRRLHEDVPDVRRAAPHVSAPLARVIGWMTQRDPTRRPSSWKALTAELAALDGGSQRLRASGARRSSGERARAAARAPGARAAARSNVPVAALVVLALSVGAAIGALAALLGG